MGHLKNTYTPDILSPAATDKYHYTTGYAYWLEGRAGNPAVATLFGRKEAEGGGFSVRAGLEGVIDIVQTWQDHGLPEKDQEWLLREGFPQEYIDYLIEALPDCKVKMDTIKSQLVFPQEPIIRLEGPIVIIKMLESINLCLENGQMAYATHGVRMMEVIEAEMKNGAPKGSASTQGLRRGPDIGASISANHGLTIGGYQTTSTGTAARDMGVPFAGTQDHAWIQTHDHQLNKEKGAPTMRELFAMKDEGRTEELQAALSKDAFRSFAFAFPDAGILLTDTYDAEVGIEDAITVIKELREIGRGANYGMRFDSGDLLAYTKTALCHIAERSERGDLLDALPDEADVSQLSHEDLLRYAEASSAAPFCADSDGITVYSAQAIREGGGYVRAWGVGTSGSHPKPPGLVQKVSAMYMKPLNGAPIPEGETMTPTMKIASSSPAKSSNPGKVNSRRFYDRDGKLSHIVIFDEDKGFDPNKQMINLKDFSDIQVNDNTAYTHEDMLEPVFDKDGKYVFKGFPQKSLYEGSSQMVTDLAAMNQQLRAELDTLPTEVRRIQRPREELLQQKLMEAFAAAKANGAGKLEIDIPALEAELPPEQAKIPVFLDQLLYQERQACEQRHNIATVSGMGDFAERFEQN